MDPVEPESDPAAAGVLEQAARRAELHAAEPRNLLVLAVYEIVFRIAWIFKTESVIIPAFVDALTGGAGSMRGWLPTLSRTGQSVPPLLMADSLRDSAHKGRILRRTSLLMAAPAALIAWMAWSAGASPPSWMAWGFLAVYVAFFSVTGLNQIALGTLHGKVIRADRRGRLLWLSGLAGPLLAIVAAWLLLGPWLEEPGIDRFAPIFAFTAGGFFVCGLITFALNEPADAAVESEAVSAGAKLRAAWWVYRGDARFRCAAHVVMLLTCIVLIFPHFQWLAREELGLGNRQLMVWVVAQNVGVACFSPLCGFLADRFGNRLVMRVQCGVLIFPPLLALIAAGPLAASPGSEQLYWFVFLLLGMSPVTMRTVTNYTLELVEPELHPQYLSTMRVCFLAPFVVSPIAGSVLDMFADAYAGACWLFGAVSLLIAVAGLLTFRMAEPRHDMAR